MLLRLFWHVIFMLITSSLGEAASVWVYSPRLDFQGSGISMYDYKSWHVDLNSLEDLVADQPIEIRFEPRLSPDWFGIVNYYPGDTFVTAKLNVTLNVGTYVSTTVFSNSIIAAYNASLYDKYFQRGTLVTGSVTFAGDTALSVTVPWGTDLSDVTLTIEDRSIVAGLGGFSRSNIGFSGFAYITSTSVPEPAIAPTILATCGIFLCRRVRQSNRRSSVNHGDQSKVEQGISPNDR